MLVQNYMKTRLLINHLCFDQIVRSHLKEASNPVINDKVLEKLKWTTFWCNVLCWFVTSLPLWNNAIDWLILFRNELLPWWDHHQIKSLLFQMGLLVIIQAWEFIFRQFHVTHFQPCRVVCVITGVNRPLIWTISLMYHCMDFTESELTT